MTLADQDRTLLRQDEIQIGLELVGALQPAPATPKNSFPKPSSPPSTVEHERLAPRTGLRSPAPSPPLIACWPPWRRYSAGPISSLADPPPSLAEVCAALSETLAPLKLPEELCVNEIPQDRHRKGRPAKAPCAGRFGWNDEDAPVLRRPLDAGSGGECPPTGNVKR